jgi:WD40 repeat protein
MTRVEKELSEFLVLPPLPSTTRGFGLHIGGTVMKEERVVYCAQSLIVQRNLKDWTQVRFFADHIGRPTTAQYAPSGEWLCSGDDQGKVLVWADRSGVQKGEGVSVGREVLDISWSGDSQRICAVGRGKEEKGKVFPWNSGGKLGEITGATAALLSCAFKPSRPYRVVASSEDFGVYFYKGPPFKYETHDKTHKNYVNSVRFAPSGDTYVTCSSDKKMLLFDGKTGAKQRVLATGAKKKGEHTGSIYEVSWSPDGAKVLSASADKTCKVTDVESGAVEHTWNFGMRRACDAKPTVDDMQVTCLWVGEHMLSVSLGGQINVLTMGDEKPTRIITGHQKAVNALAVDRESGFVYSACSSGRVVRTSVADGDAQDMLGDPHKGAALKFVEMSCDRARLFSIAVDDRLVTTSLADTETLPLSFGAIAASAEEKTAESGDSFAAKLDGAARAMAVGRAASWLVAVGTHKKKLLIYGESLAVKQSLIVSFVPSAMSFNDDDSLLAVGGEDRNIYIYQRDGDSGDYALVRRICAPDLIKKKVVDLAFQPSAAGSFLASSDGNRHIWLWDMAAIMASEAESGLDKKDAFAPANERTSFQFHRAMAPTIAWSPDGTQLASGGHDSTIFVWVRAAEAVNDYIRYERAIFGSISAVRWLDDERLVAAGADATVRFLKIQDATPEE